MSISSIQNIPDIGVKFRWNGDSLQVSPPLERLSEAQKLAVAAYKAEILEKKRSEQAALFEIALQFAKQFADEAIQLLGGFRRVSVPGLHETYCESLARVMRGLVPPIGAPAFGEVLLQAELNQERQAMMQTDNQTTTETPTCRSDAL